MPPDDNPDAYAVGDGPVLICAGVDEADDVIDRVIKTRAAEPIDTPVGVLPVTTNTRHLKVGHKPLP
jgi:hypothetical protein